MYPSVFTTSKSSCKRNNLKSAKGAKCNSAFPIMNGAALGGSQNGSFSSFKILRLIDININPKHPFSSLKTYKSRAEEGFLKKYHLCLVEVALRKTTTTRGTA